MLQSYIHQEVIAMRITESGYKTHCRQVVDWKYSATAQIYIYSSQSCYCQNNRKWL